jgi:hypothetical protein
MKNSAVISMIILLLTASCSSLMPAPELPVYTPLPPTMTPDPCGPEAISDEIEMVRNWLNEFQEVAFIASNTPQDSLISPVMKLQEIHQNLNSLAVPGCMQGLKKANFNYTASLVMYYSKLMNKKTAKEAAADLENSEVLWPLVETEYEKVIRTGRLEFVPLTSYEGVLIPETGFKAIAFNESDQTVNVRAAPDLNANILTLLETGVQAIIIGRTEKGDWLRVSVESVNGWIFTEMVALNVDINEIDVVN